MAANSYYSGPPSPHFDGVRFRNLDGARGGKSLAELLRWKLGGTKAQWPEWVDTPTDAPPPRVHHGIRASFVGHATVLVQMTGINILTDPVWSKRASPLQFAGPKRVHAPGIAFDALPPIDLVLLSHNHYDHLDSDTLRHLVDRDAPVIVTPLGNDTIVEKTAPAARILTLDWFDQVEALPGVVVHAEPVSHWSARGQSDRNEALWAGFVVEAGGNRLYFAGDTGFAAGAPFVRTAARHGPFDLALIPIGAYEPRWFMADAHMNPQEAVEAHVLLGSPSTLGIHHGTFQLTDEAIDAPAIALGEALLTEPRAQDFRILTPGTAWDISGSSVVGTSEQLEGK